LQIECLLALAGNDSQKYETGYDAKSKSYPTNISAPAFTVPDVAFLEHSLLKKMIDVFERKTRNC
jgi:hypothetical protein